MLLVITHDNSDELLLWEMDSTQGLRSSYSETFCKVELKSAFRAPFIVFLLVLSAYHDQVGMTIGQLVWLAVDLAKLWVANL